MTKPKKRRKRPTIHIRTMNDIRMAKEIYRYEVMLQDQALKGSSNRLKKSVGLMVKKTIRDAAQAFLIRKIVSFVRARI